MSVAKLLVVNDDPDGCELIARLLERHGWEAVRAHSHTDAMQRINHPGPDPDEAVHGALVDFSSGGTASNLKLLDSIRHGEPQARGLPVIILAGSSQNWTFAYQSGADAYLVRPFHADDLTSAVAAVLARSPEERAAYRRSQLEAAKSA